jgi:hypothetical protein
VTLPALRSSVKNAAPRPGHISCLAYTELYASLTDLAMPHAASIDIPSEISTL